MKKIKKISLIIILLIGIFLIFVTFESIRLMNYPNTKPLIVLNKVIIEADNLNNKEYSEVYYSLGFSLKMDYYLNEQSSLDNHMYYLIGEEFRLFKKIRLWVWIS